MVSIRRESRYLIKYILGAGILLYQVFEGFSSGRVFAPTRHHTELFFYVSKDSLAFTVMFFIYIVLSLICIYRAFNWREQES
jgi:magnesium-transporting ATPase (P-type)